MLLREDHADLSAGDALAIIQPDPQKLSSAFLDAIFQRVIYQRWLRASALGSTGLKRVTAEALERMPIPLPPLSSQAVVIEQRLHSGERALETAQRAASSRTSARVADDSGDDGVYSPGEGQGFQIDAKLRRAIEMAAMAEAQLYFEAQGYTVKVRGRPYDLLCTRGSEVLYVEVKGTTGSATQVALTRGEVEHAKKHPETTALFVLHSLRASEREGVWVIDGGQRRLICPWRVDERALYPINYWYRLC